MIFEIISRVNVVESAAREKCTNRKLIILQKTTNACVYVCGWAEQTVLGCSVVVLIVY